MSPGGPTARAAGRFRHRYRPWPGATSLCAHPPRALAVPPALHDKDRRETQAQGDGVFDGISFPATEFVAGNPYRKSVRCT